MLSLRSLLVQWLVNKSTVGKATNMQSHIALHEPVESITDNRNTETPRSSHQQLEHTGQNNSI